MQLRVLYHLSSIIFLQKLPATLHRIDCVHHHLMLLHVCALQATIEVMYPTLDAARQALYSMAVGLYADDQMVAYEAVVGGDDQGGGHEEVELAYASACSAVVEGQRAALACVVRLVCRGCWLCMRACSARTPLLHDRQAGRLSAASRDDRDVPGVAL